MHKSKKNKRGGRGPRRNRKRGAAGQNEARERDAAREAERRRLGILRNVWELGAYIRDVSEQITKRQSSSNRQLEKTMQFKKFETWLAQAKASSPKSEKGLKILKYLFKVPGFNGAIKKIVDHNGVLSSPTSAGTSSFGGSRKKRQRRSRRRKGGAYPILGSVVGAVGILMMWFGNGQRQSDAVKFLDDTIERFRRITGLNMRNLIYYIQQQDKNPNEYPSLRVHCAPGGASDFSTTHPSSPSTGLVPPSDTTSTGLVPYSPEEAPPPHDWREPPPLVTEGPNADTEPVPLFDPEHYPGKLSEPDMPFYRNGKLMTCEEIVGEKNVEGADGSYTAFEITKMFGTNSIDTLQDIKSVLEYAARKKGAELVGDPPRRPDGWLEWLGSLFSIVSSSGGTIASSDGTRNHGIKNWRNTVGNCSAELHFTNR